MEAFLAGFYVIRPTLVHLTWLYWVLGSLVYSLKFVWPKFDAFTNYGKLQPRALQSARLPWSVENRLGFTAFYVFGFVWNILVMLLQVLLVCPLNSLPHVRRIVICSVLTRAVVET